MTKQTRRRFSPEYKEQSVARLSEPGATHSSVAAELGVTPTQLKTWRLELEAAGSAAATAAQKAEAAELVQLRRDNKRLTEEVEVLRKAQVLVGERLEHFDGLEGIPHLDPHNRRRRHRFDGQDNIGVRQADHIAHHRLAETKQRGEVHLNSARARQSGAASSVLIDKLI